MKKPLVALVALAVIALSVWFAWREHNPSVRTEGTRVLYGNVDIRQIALAFEGSGRIQALHAEEGTRVVAGDVLAVLDTRTLALQAEAAQAQVEVQRHTLARLRNGARPQELAQARHALTAAQADATRAQQDLLRTQRVFDASAGRGVSALSLDAAKSAAQMAQARARQQHAALQLLEDGARAEDLASAEASVAAAQAQLALLRHQIDQGTLRAPTAAVVRARLLEPGDMASPQRPVFTLALTAPKWVRVWVSETDLGRIHPGMAARMWTDSHPDQAIAGTVGTIAAVAEFTPKAVQTEELRTSLVYEVRILVQDLQDRLRLGQPATVEIDLDA